MNKPLFPAQQQFPSCFVPPSAKITPIPSPLVSASPSNLRGGPRAEGGFGSLQSQPRGPVEVGGCRALGLGAGITQSWGKGLPKHMCGCSPGELGRWWEEEYGSLGAAGKVAAAVE